MRRACGFMVSSAPSRAGVEGWPGDQKIARACRLRRSPGLAAVPSRFALTQRGWCSGLPVALPFISGANLERGTRGVSDAPQWPRQYFFRLTVARRRRLVSRVTPALLELTHRLPVHEVRDGCGGRSGPLWVTQVPQLSPQRLGETKKRQLTFRTACSRAAARMNRVPR